MEKVIRYKSIDKKIFEEEKDCIEYESLILRIKEIMSELNPVPETNDFCNGEGYVQQKKEVVERAMIELVKVSIKNYEFQEEFEDDPYFVEVVEAAKRSHNKRIKQGLKPHAKRTS